MKMPREFIACVLWTAALVCMIFGTADSIQDGHNSIGLAWGLFLAAGAHLFTMWAVVMRHHAAQEVSVEQIVEVVDALHRGRSDVSRLR